MATKTIKGQAWISGNSLLQDQTIISTTGAVSSNVVALIDNIWEDLTSSNGTFKSNDKKTYFYWEYKMTDSFDDTVEVTVKIECPRPKNGLFTEPYDPSVGKNDWEKYWLSKFKVAYDNAAKYYTIQPKEIVFPGTEYVNPQGEVVTVEERSEANNNLGDITNLLTLF